MSEHVEASELHSVGLLEGLSDEALKLLADHSQVRRFEAMQTIFREGDEGNSLYVVRKGLIKIVRANAPETTLTTLKDGAVFGELAVLDPAPRSASAIAIDASEAIELPSEALDKVFDDDPTAARKMLGSMARSLTMAREAVVHDNKLLDQKVNERTEQLRETQLEVIRRLGLAAEFRDDDTGLHITRMSRFCAKLAKAAGLSDADCEILLHAAPMHDIGKIGIPDSILLKPGKLEDEEFEIMKTHTLIGGELLAGSTSPVMELAQVIALNHHEKWNGRGYPAGKKEEEIPFVARIASICDVFDALTSVRPYKQAWPVEKALALIEEQAGNDFDPNLAKLFLEISDEIVKMREDLQEGEHEAEAKELSAYPEKATAAAE